MSARCQTRVVTWADDEVLAAVRRTLGSPRSPGSWTFEGVDLDTSDLLVRFRAESEPGVVFAAVYPLDDLPHGPGTGLVCDSPDAWASEVLWDLDEQVDTGGLRRVERRRRPDGVVVVAWRPPR